MVERLETRIYGRGPCLNFAVRIRHGVGRLREVAQAAKSSDKWHVAIILNHAA
jgi:hypothetical protein